MCIRDSLWNLYGPGWQGSLTSVKKYHRLTAAEKLNNIIGQDPFRSRTNLVGPLTGNCSANIKLIYPEVGLLNKGTLAYITALLRGISSATKMSCLKPAGEAATA